MFMNDLKKAFCLHGRLAGVASMGAVVALGATATLAVDSDWEDDCNLPPTCEVLGLNFENEIELPECSKYVGTNSGSICAWVDLQCPDSSNMKVILKIEGSEVASRKLDDLDVRQKVFFDIPDFCKYDEETELDAEIIVKDKDNDTKTTCRFSIEIECGKLPECYLNGKLMHESRDKYPMVVFDVKPGDVLEVLEVCARSACDEEIRVELMSRPPFMEPIGAHTDFNDGGKTVCITTHANDVVEGGFAEGTYWAKFKCTDLEGGLSRILKVGYRYTDPQPTACDEPPLCEVLEGDSMTVDIDSTGLFTVCGSTACKDCDVSIEMTDGPSYVTLDTADVPGNDDGLCNAYLVAPITGDEGSATATFTITDCDGNTSECSIEINVPEPTPLLACQENEDRLPNNSFDDASVIDAGECADAFGVNLHGVLDTPVFKSGDVDYYRIVGLTPGETYNATIVAGLTSRNGFTDTMLGWLVAEGVTVASDDNSGPMTGYSKIAFTADENGVATLAITGHGDSDFNGSMDVSMPYEEYGFGGYMLSIRAEAGDVMPLERQADLNGDGVVDTADLGALIGVFGASAN